MPATSSPHLQDDGSLGRGGRPALRRAAMRKSLFGRVSCLHEGLARSQAPALRPAQLMMRMRSCSGVAKCWSRAWKTWSSREAVMACCRRGSAPSAYHSQNISGRVGRIPFSPVGQPKRARVLWQANRWRNMGGIGAKPERPAIDGRGTQAEMEGRA